MQEFPTVSASATSSDPFEQLRSAALVDTSSQARAFSDFLNLMSKNSTSRDYTTSTRNAELGLLSQDSSAASLQAAAVVQSVATAAATAADNAAEAVAVPVRVADSTSSTPASTQTTTSTATSTSTQSSAEQQRLAAAKNAPVSREAFEEVRPVLAKAGLSDKEIEDLAARSRSGTLTWGQLVHTLSGKMSGAKKAVELTDEQTQSMQALFQKLGFSSDESTSMVKDVAAGDGLKVLSNVQKKLATMPDDQSLGVNKNELADFFKALRLPQDVANKLTNALNSDSTVADMKNALAQMAQAMKEQHAKGNSLDKDIAQAVGNAMEKDLAKSTRDSNQSTGITSSENSGSKVTYELKTKDRNDTSFFSEHEKRQAKSEDAAWQSFVNKVRPESDTLTKSSLTQTSQESLDSLLAKTSQSLNVAQGKAEAGTQTKAYSNVTAPKVLSQVQEAMLKDLGQGRKQLTLQLDPENLGKLQIVIQVRDKDVTAILRTEDPDTAKMLSGQLETIRKTLEDQGLKVQNLEVQTGLAGGQNQQQATFNADQHNQAQQRQEMNKLFTQMRLLRQDSGDVAHEMQNQSMQAILADRGLHIVA